MKYLKNLFRKHTVTELARAELEELELLRYQEDARRDFHTAQVERYRTRIEKLKGLLAQQSAGSLAGDQAHRGALR